MRNVYDDNGNRVSQTAGGQETRFLVDTAQPLAQVLLEYRPSGLVTASFVYGNGLVSQTRDGVLSFYHADGLGSTRALTDAAGAVLNLYRLGNTRRAAVAAASRAEQVAERGLSLCHGPNARPAQRRAAYPGCLHASERSQIAPDGTEGPQPRKENGDPRVAATPDKTRRYRTDLHQPASPRAVPTSGTVQAHPTGLEPVAFGSVDRCSIQLS